MWLNFAIPAKWKKMTFRLLKTFIKGGVEGSFKFKSSSPSPSRALLSQPSPILQLSPTVSASTAPVRTLSHSYCHRLHQCVHHSRAVTAAAGPLPLLAAPLHFPGAVVRYISSHWFRCWHWFRALGSVSLALPPASF